jgi:hypothetical protein
MRINARLETGRLWQILPSPATKAQTVLNRATHKITTKRPAHWQAVIIVCRIGWQVIFVFITHVTCDSSSVFWPYSPYWVFTKLIFGMFLNNTLSSQSGSKRDVDSGNPIAAKPLRAMGLLAFLPPVFVPHQCFALCSPAGAGRAGERAKIDA